VLLKPPAKALISFGQANWFALHSPPISPPSPPPYYRMRISAKSRDKMHNNFIHSGRCHKSVLNRVNNFVQHLPSTASPELRKVLLCLARHPHPFSYIRSYTQKKILSCYFFNFKLLCFKFLYVTLLMNEY